MSRLQNQRRLFLDLVGLLRPHWRRDPNQPALVQRWLAEHRAGSRDRKLYRELAYTLWRILPWVEQAEDDELVAIVASCAAAGPATDAFIAAFRLEVLPPHCEPAALLPTWVEQECPATLEPAQRAALLQRAPLWIRLQKGPPEALQAELADAGWHMTASGVSPRAWRLEGEGDLTRTAAYQRGEFEIQDFGSQSLLEVVRPQPREYWFDACAGAGGKTLQLATLVGVEGRVLAHDVRAAALCELRQRVQRAGFRQVEVTERSPDRTSLFDGVLVDAPCTGSGTWRRAPHLKWTTTPDTIARAATRQLRLLQQYAQHVRPGGRLVYATCSLCSSENEAVITRFLAGQSDFAPEPLPDFGSVRAGAMGLTVLPADLDSDAFFVSSLRRR